MNSGFFSFSVTPVRLRKVMALTIIPQNQAPLLEEEKMDKGKTGNSQRKDRVDDETELV